MRLHTSLKTERIGSCELALEALRKEPALVTSADRAAVADMITHPTDGCAYHERRIESFIAWLDERTKQDARLRDVSKNIKSILRSLWHFAQTSKIEGGDVERNRAIAYVDAWREFSESELEPEPPSRYW